MTENEKMRPFVINGPKTGKGKIIALLVIISIFMAIYPVAFLFNSAALVFGMPMLMFWTIICGVTVMAIVLLARKWEVY